MFYRFEKLVHPYPEEKPTRPPQKLMAFLWHCTQGFRGYIAAMALCTAAVGAFDALLLAMLGSIIDKLAILSPARLWTDARGHLLVIGAIIMASPLLIGLNDGFFNLGADPLVVGGRLMGVSHALRHISARTVTRRYALRIQKGGSETVQVGSS